MGVEIFPSNTDIFLYGSHSHMHFLCSRTDFISETTPGDVFLPLMRLNCHVISQQV